MGAALSRHREFLLGLLQSEEVEKLEDHYFRDNALFAELVDEEAALVSDYRLDRLGSELRQRFEVYYLSSHARREEFDLQSGISDLVTRISRDVKAIESEI